MAVIKRHKVCDICGEVVGINKRYIIVKSKDYVTNGVYGFSDNRKHHVCIDCFNKFLEFVEQEIKGKNEMVETKNN